MLRMAAEDVAKGYIEVIEGTANGRIIDTQPYATRREAA